MALEDSSGYPGNTPGPPDPPDHLTHLSHLAHLAAGADGGLGETSVQTGSPSTTMNPNVVCLRWTSQHFVDYKTHRKR